MNAYIYYTLIYPPPMLYLFCIDFTFCITLCHRLFCSIDSRSSVSAHACLFRRLAFSILFFLAQQMKNSLETQFTSAVILERRAESE